MKIFQQDAGEGIRNIGKSLSGKLRRVLFSGEAAMAMSSKAKFRCYSMLKEVDNLVKDSQLGRSLVLELECFAQVAGPHSIFMRNSAVASIISRRPNEHTNSVRPLSCAAFPVIAA